VLVKLLEQTLNRVRGRVNLPAGKKYRILLLVRGGVAAPYIMQGFGRALLSRGHELVILDLSRDHRISEHDDHKSVIASLRDEINTFQPDFAIGYGASAHLMLPADDPQADKIHLFEACGIPYVSLFYDSPYFGIDRLIPTLGSPLHTICLWDKYYIERIRRDFGVECHHLQLATDFTGVGSVDAKKEFAVDVAFLGSVNMEYSFRETARQHDWPEWLESFTEDIIEAFFSTHSPFLEIYMDRLGALDEGRKAYIRSLTARSTPASPLYAIHSHLHHAIRSRVLGGITASKVHIFGGLHGDYANTNLVFSEGIDYHTGAPGLYSSARINLNISSGQLVNSVNQRIFDVPACGGFLLTDYRPIVEELFDTTTEMITYRDTGELNRLVAYYLEHDAERKQLAANARKRVLSEHTFQHRTNDLIEIIEQEVMAG